MGFKIPACGLPCGTVTPSAKPSVTLPEEPLCPPTRGTLLSPFQRERFGLLSLHQRDAVRTSTTLIEEGHGLRDPL